MFHIIYMYIYNSHDKYVWGKKTRDSNAASSASFCRLFCCTASSLSPPSLRCVVSFANAAAAAKIYALLNYVHHCNNTI